MQIQEVNQQILNCDYCNLTPHIGQLVPGVGPQEAKIMLVGEAPGKQEAQTGQPFVGNAGKLLNKLMADFLPIPRNQMFITSIVKYLPPYKTPILTDISHGQTHLNDQIVAIDPQLIVLLGRSALMGSALGIAGSITQLRGKFISLNRRNYFITLHPASALRSNKYLELLKQDFLKLTDYFNSRIIG